MIVYFQVFVRDLSRLQSHAVLEETAGKVVVYNILTTFERTSHDKDD